MISKTFCPLPWVHQATYSDGSILLCCVAENESDKNLNRGSLKEAWNSEHWKNTRKQMLADQAPTACQRCWVEEKNGYRSHRVTELAIWENRLGPEGMRMLLDHTQEDGTLTLEPRALDLRLGNTCNLQCAMCRPQDSSKWTGLAKKIHAVAEDPLLRGDMGYKTRINQADFEWQDRPEFWTDLEEKLPNLTEIIIGGGEPMLLHAHTEFLERAVRSGHCGHIQLRYHTNLTVLPKHFLDLWVRFERVEILASIDAFG
ncbi:MAG TPA: twitch domain-containing radical SAM protein, partial [Bdellovibrionales bacterium]|nr:twitch domain-containing radical SAM protein [Bdellovibrionales bacterium]